MARASDHLLAVSWVMVFGDVVLERRLKRHLYISQLAWEHLGVCVCVSQKSYRRWLGRGKSSHLCLDCIAAPLTLNWMSGSSRLINLIDV